MANVPSIFSAPTIVVGFSGPATVRQADEIANRLRQSLLASNRIEVDCSDITEVDLSFIQLILATARSAQNTNKILVLTNPASGALLEALTFCGVRNGPRKGFWLEGREA